MDEKPSSRYPPQGQMSSFKTFGGIGTNKDLESENVGLLRGNPS
jgi:hypothetical protein